MGCKSFEGTYVLIWSYNFERYLTEAGVSLIHRSALNSVHLTVTVKEESEDTLVFETKSALRTSTMRFKLDEIFDEITIDGRKSKSLVKRNGNTLIHTQDVGPCIHSVTTREFLGNVMIAKFEINDVTCIRVYDKIE